MARFSERHQYIKVSDVLQIESIDFALRMRLWNQSRECYSNIYSITDKDGYAKFFAHQYLGIDSEDFYEAEALAEMKRIFTSGLWHEVYDLVEFIAESLPNEYYRELYWKSINVDLTSGHAGYRLIDCVIVPIIGPEEIIAIDEAINSPLVPVREHINTSLRFYSDRTDPDYRNSIKEAVSAVEAVCCLVVKQPKATLGQAIKKLEESGVKIHPAMATAFEKLYGYTSDERGIRHSLVEEDTIDATEAKFMLITCSAFVNYIVELCASMDIKI